ncbi:uncharacterized protein LOC105666521 isoform X1 [Bombus terrestris]|uniref:Uncharacterized protein LOC105666521 isoform X1 n=1 Tax=Bombus terrestris TaxID=30195 RepID=A0A9B2JVG4_BOMTE|nr:uncharacterized protein LOC105666521 isoform X1 [Bombus terrestris]
MIDRYKSTRIYKESIVMYSCRSTFINSVLIQCVIGEETRYVKLTIWSIIGFIFLQKGVISLCEKTKARNDTINMQEKFSRWNKGELFRESNVTENRFKIIKFQIGTQREDIAVDHSGDTVSDEQWPRELFASDKTDSIGSGISRTISTIKRRTTIHRKQDAKDVYSTQTSTIYSNNRNEVEKVNHKVNVILPLTSNKNPYETEDTVINNSTPSATFESKDFGTTNLIKLTERNFFEHEHNKISDESIGKNKNETKSRRRPVNRVGTAIAITMLVIGVVMLLIGPLIVIIRTFNNRRRNRQMLKSRCYNDQPPTYEEATLMDETPRYSTLQLDATIDSFSP